MGTMWCLYVLTPSSWCKTDVHSTDLGKGRDSVYFNFPFVIKLAIGLNVFPRGSISTWEDLTTYFLARFFPPGRISKLQNDILMFQKHQGESLSEARTSFKGLLQKVPHHGIDLWLQIQIFYDHVSFHLKCEIDHAAGSKLRDKNAEESWEIIENLALYEHEGWNDPRDFAKPVKAISLPQNTLKSLTDDFLSLKIKLATY
ncbi:zinc finger, CCHC-type containing protein [Tanacetum coccineum]